MADVGAFVDAARTPIRTRDRGDIADLTFGAKDLYDIAGDITGGGNPDIMAAGQRAVATSPALLRALDAGATFVGKTHTDELACGMFGTNTHFGIPFNANAMERVPGGSSCGSAAAVAAGLCDFAFGTDTAGSSRTPASFCGIYGVRTSHGRISMAGVMPMAPSFDTVGWLARDARTLQRVGALFFADVGRPRMPRFLLAVDAFALAEPVVADALLPIARALGPREDVRIYDPPYGDWPAVFAPLQGHELWATRGAWASEPGRTLTAGVRDRIAASSTIADADVAFAMQRRDILAQRLIAMLGNDGVLVMPTAHDLPPPRDTSAAGLHAFRERTLALTAIASLARAPQVSLPVTRVGGIPAGLSLLAAPGCDALLLDVAAALTWIAA